MLIILYVQDHVNKIKNWKVQLIVLLVGDPAAGSSRLHQHQWHINEVIAPKFLLALLSIYPSGRFSRTLIGWLANSTLGLPYSSFYLSLSQQFQVLGLELSRSATLKLYVLGLESTHSATHVLRLELSRSATHKFTRNWVVVLRKLNLKLSCRAQNWIESEA